MLEVSVNRPLLRYPIAQFAYVVPNLDEGIHHWVTTLGAGPFFVSRHHRGDRHTYRGQPDDATFSYAFGQSGPVQIQLIEVDDASRPSIYRDMFTADEGGFHHVAMLIPVEDMTVEIRRFTEAGFEIASTMGVGPSVAYLDTRPALGFFVELYARTERVMGLFESVRNAHEQWDGITDPIRMRLPAIPDTGRNA
jgi:hypothetical protein